MPIRSLNGVDMGIRSLNGLDNINPISATLPLEINDSVISLKGVSALGTSNQYLRMNGAGSGLEFITLNLVDTTSSQIIYNKSLRTTTLNYFTNENTFIGTPSANTFVDGILHLNSNNNRAIINLVNNPNHSIYFKTNYNNVANRMSFYEFGKIDFYTGNDLNITQPNMPLRFSIGATDIISNVDTTINGSLTSQSLNVLKDNDNGLVEIFKSNVDTGNNNGTAKLHFTISTTSTGDNAGTILTNVAQMGIFDNTTIFRCKNLVNDIELQAQTNINLKKNDDTPVNLNFYKGTNYVSLVANNALSSNITVKLPITGGTLAILGDIPEARLPIFIDTTGSGSNKITLKGLDGIGNANQIIQVNSSGDGFVYANPSSLTATNPLSISNNIISLGGLTNFGSSGQVLTSTGSGLTYSTPSSLTIADVLFLVRTQAEDISTFAGNALSGFPPTDIGSTTRNVNITSDLLFLNFVGATFTLSNNSAEKLVISNTVSKFKNLLLVSPTSTSLEANAQFQVDTTSATKMVLKTTATDQDVEFAMINGNQSGFIKYLASDNSLNFNSFQKYFFRIGATQRIDFDSDITTNFNTYSFDIAGNQAIGLDSADYYSNVSNSYDFNISSNTVFSLTGTICLSKQTLLVSSSATTRDDNNTNFEVNNGSGFTKMLLKTTATNQNVELAFKNGNTQGNIKMLSSNFLDFSSFAGYVFNGFTQINYNNLNSFTQFTSNLPNSKVGFHFYQGTNNFQLYLDFSSSTLVSSCNRFQINSTTPSITDSAGRGLIFKTTTGNFVGVQVGNAVDKLSVNFGSAGSVFTTNNNDLDSATFTSYNWYISAGSLRFQGDRNLVIYDANNNALFASNTSTSDRDKKENIVDLEETESINVVKQLKTYRYNYKNDDEKTPQIGFMADETKTLIPECIKTITKEDKVSNLLFKENIVPHLVNTIQYALNKIELLEAEIDFLKKSM